MLEIIENWVSLLDGLAETATAIADLGTARQGYQLNGS